MRVVLTCLLLMTAVPAWAEWVKLEPSERGFFSSVLSGGTVYYIDPSTITREGNFRRVWEIHDLGEKGAQGERSILASVEYDCAENRMRTLKATGKSQRMARGEIIPLRQVFDEWITLRPGKDDEMFFRILKAVCVP